MFPCPQTDDFNRAVSARKTLLSVLDGPTDAYRLIHSDADGFVGVTVDRLGPALLIETHTPSADVARIVSLLKAHFGDQVPLFLKSKHSDDPAASLGVQLSGKSLDPSVLVQEEGVCFSVNIINTPHTGLFLDSRAARRRVRATASGRRVLNLFAYTGGFGVAAATGDARSTTNVDAKRSALEKAARNYALNHLPTDTRTFLKSDVVAYLKRLDKRGQRFDMVILDPPPVSRRTNRDGLDTRTVYPRLIARCLGVVSAGGYLIAGLNNPKVNDTRFLEMIETGAELTGRELKMIEPIPVDPDFPKVEYRPTARFVAIMT